MGNDDKLNPGGIFFVCSNEIENYKCKVCPNFETKCVTSLKYHVTEGHRSENLEKGYYKCLKCQFVTSSKYVLVRHGYFNQCPTMRNKPEKEESSELDSRLRNEPMSLFPQDNESESKWFHCEQCPRKYKTRSGLKNHVMYKHTKPEDVQWFACQQCQFKSKFKYALKSHIAYSHSKPEEIHWLQCDQCPSKFLRRSSLNRHTKCAHSTPEDFQWFRCEHCPCRFKQRGHLNRHVKLFHGGTEDIQWSECDQCSAKFKRRDILKKHIMLCHTKSEDIQWFECDRCGTKYKQKGHLTTHMGRCRFNPDGIFSGLNVSSARRNSKEKLA